MKRQLNWILLCSLLMMVMTACNLPANDNEAIQLTSVASTDIAASQPEDEQSEATAEVTESVTQEVIETSNTDIEETTINKPPASTNTTTSTNTNIADTSVITSNTSCSIRTDRVTYIVQAGDTLAKIASRTGSTVADLTQANCLANANILSVGQQLYVPRTPDTPTTNTDVVIVSTDKTCRIIVNKRTEIVDLPQGTSASILGYLPAGSIVEPTVQISALKTYGFNFNGQTGWINIQPTGDCSQLPDLYDQNDDDNRCIIHVNTRTEVVNAPQGTGRTILGYLEAGSVVEPTLHFEGLPYYGFNYQGQTGWINATPTGDCSNLQTGSSNDDPSPAGCTITTANSLKGYALPDASSTVVDNLLAGITYNVTGKHPASWYKVKFPESGMEGWVQTEASGNCNNLPGQVYECQFVGDTTVPIYRNPEIGSDQLDTLQTGDVYRFGAFGGEWTSGDVTGYWVEVFYTIQRPLAGFIQNTGGHLEGACPSR